MRLRWLSTTPRGSMTEVKMIDAVASGPTRGDFQRPSLADAAGSGARPNGRPSRSTLKKAISLWAATPSGESWEKRFSVAISARAWTKSHSAQMSSSRVCGSMGTTASPSRLAAM